jgi:TRAP-type C4-dicarboxylate transport system substrate-binding protein
MMTLFKRGLWIFFGICLVLSVSVIAGEKQITLKLATLAPEGSPWMKAFNKVNRELIVLTGGMVRMRAYPGGVMGDDHTVLRKMRIGQIQIAGLMGIGLGEINKDLQVLGTPFLFRNYEEVDHILPKITDQFENALEETGYVLLGWSEIGFIYMMSNTPMSSLEAVQGAKVWMPEGDFMSQAVFQKAGVSPVPLAVSDVLVALQTGLVDVIYGTPFGAIALQWFTKVKYITRVPLSYSLGAVVMTQKAFERILPDHRKKLKEVFRKNLVPINAQTRRDNEEALELMGSEGIQYVDLSPQELARFQKIAHEAMEGIAGKVFSKAILKKVNKLLAEFRKGKKIPLTRVEG